VKRTTFVVTLIWVWKQSSVVPLPTNIPLLPFPAVRLGRRLVVPAHAIDEILRDRSARSA
jgi:hypothetical protein